MTAGVAPAEDKPQSSGFAFQFSGELFLVHLSIGTVRAMIAAPRRLSLFTGWSFSLLSVAAVVAALAVTGCERRLAPEQYGEITHEVPAELNKPYPLPQLDEPAEGPAQEPATGQK